MGPKGGLGSAGRCLRAGTRWEVLGGAERCWDAPRHELPLLSDPPPPTSMLRSNEHHLPHAVCHRGPVGRRISLDRILKPLEATRGLFNRSSSLLDPFMALLEASQVLLDAS